MKHTYDSFSRDLKRIEVARRMVSHHVRTQTIVDYTSLTRNRLATLRRRWCVSEGTRRRGPPPRSVELFLRTARARSEGAAIVSICIAFGALPRYLHCQAGVQPRLDIADRLCEAFEAFRTCIPHSTFDFEELLLLARELEAGVLLEISNCRVCKCMILSLKLELPIHVCVHCAGHDSAVRALSESSVARA